MLLHIVYRLSGSIKYETFFGSSQHIHHPGKWGSPQTKRTQVGFQLDCESESKEESKSIQKGKKWCNAIIFFFFCWQNDTWQKNNKIEIIAFLRPFQWPSFPFFFLWCATLVYFFLWVIPVYFIMLSSYLFRGTNFFKLKANAVLDFPVDL